MTSVGATTGVPETSASFSSGGFSNIFAQPSYQASAVSAYLTKLGNTNSGKFKPTGRAFPDIAAQGENVEIVFQQETGLVAGTSCSSPIFASIISLINDRLAAAGKGPLGFLNPFLYGAAASTFTDITTGSNPGCNTNGFPAEAGWDPVRNLRVMVETAWLMGFSGHWSGHTQLCQAPRCCRGCCRAVIRRIRTWHDRAQGSGGVCFTRTGVLGTFYPTYDEMEYTPLKRVSQWLES